MLINFSAVQFNTALKWLAGESFTSVQYLYRLGRTTVGDTVHETCQVLVTALLHDYMKVL